MDDEVHFISKSWTLSRLMAYLLYKHWMFNVRGTARMTVPGDSAGV